MTITYSGQVANAKLCAFSRMLFYWKGSIYKLMYAEMLVFVGFYTSFSLIYRFALQESQKRIFEHIVLYCEKFTNLIPLSFVLGFYVAIVVTRWWNQYLNIPWPDRVMMYVSTMIEGIDESSRVIRRTLMRYLMLASLLVYQGTSISVKKRFPTWEHLIEAGVLTRSEHKMLEAVTTPHGKWWVPFVWIVNILKDCRVEGRISDDYLLKTLIDEMMTYRGHLGMLYSYDWISIPLVYTQVTTLAVYTYFLGSVLGKQFLDPTQGYPGHDVDLFVPMFTLLQFFFYMGWLKVAEQMINPFGEDDDDFDMNWVIDRNMQVSWITVDELHQTYPKLEKDIYYDEGAPEFLPYTKSALSSIKQPFMGSTAQLSVSDDGMQVVNHMETITEGEVFQSNTFQSGYIHSSPTSPLASPSRGRRYANNLIASDKSQLNASKANNLGSSLKAGLNMEGRSLFQTMQGSTVKHAHSYIDHWLHGSNGRMDRTRSIEIHKVDETKAFSPYSESYPKAGMHLPNFYKGPQKDDESDHMSCVSDDVQKPHSDAKDEDSAKENDTNTKPEDNKVETESTVPNITITEENEKNGNNEELKTVVIMGSNDSLVEYEAPNSSHSTVNSMTPLIKAEELEEIISNV